MRIFLATVQWDSLDDIYIDCWLYFEYWSGHSIPHWAVFKVVNFYLALAIHVFAVAGFAWTDQHRSHMDQIEGVAVLHIKVDSIITIIIIEDAITDIIAILVLIWLCTPLPRPYTEAWSEYNHTLL